jgi:hypothetical protein
MSYFESQNQDEFDEYEDFYKEYILKENFYPYDEEKKGPYEEETNGMQITEDESKKNSEIVENINEIQNNKTDIIIVKTETGKIPSEQKSTDNFNNISKNEILTNKDILMKDSSSIDININEILNFNKINLKTDDGKSEDNTFNSLKRKRGRNGPGCTGGEHNKFSDDNLRRKVKHLVLKNVFDFINEKIRSMYSDINKGIFTKQLLTINQKQISDATILFNKKFLEKPLKDIFSVEISKRYTNYLESHNKNLINFLMNEEEDENKRVYFNNLFNLKFIECLEHFRGTADYIHLEGMKTFDEIKDDFAKDKNYLDVLTNYVEEYENITRNKKERTEFSYDY